MCQLLISFKFGDSWLLYMYYRSIEPCYPLVLISMNCYRKIELITSYGPNSDDDSDSDASNHSSHHSSKKKKVDNLKPSKKEKKKDKDVSIGPQLPPGYVVPVEVKETKPVEIKTQTADLPKITEVPAETEKLKKKKQAIVVEGKVKTVSDQTNVKNNVENVRPAQEIVNKVKTLRRLVFL